MKPAQITYPVSRKDDTISDDYHGTTISDPYRWLEDDHSEETIDWVKRQNKVTFDYLHKIPGREGLIDRLTALWNYPKYSLPFKEGKKYYFFKNNGLQNQSALYSINELNDEPTLVLDPNNFSDDGTTSLGGTSFNKNGDLLGYSISEGGSDWRTIKVIDLKSGETLADEINWAKFSGISWAKNGFYYSRYPAPEGEGELSDKNEFHKLYFHKLGTDQSEDRLIYSDTGNPQRNVYAGVSEDEKFLFISASEGTSGNALKVKMIGEKKLKTFYDKFDFDFNVIDNNENSILILTNHNAPNKRIIAIDFDNPDMDAWKELIPESKEPIRSVSIVGNKLFVGYLKDASSSVKVFDMHGKFISDLNLPGIGTLSNVSGKKEGTEGFYSFTSFTQPSTIFKLNTETLKSELFRKSEINFDASDYVTKQEWYTSKDGTRVPMFITHKKGLKLDGTNPTLLYGYGGFNISLLPSFGITRLPLLENGGVLAVANLRGGGEFGTAWHEAGTLDRKQNVFDDFIAAGEYLVDKKYTSSDKLAIQGGSNGGLLVGACLNQRPDLFKVGFPAVGVLDMLRYHQFTIGWAWAGDYGRSDDPEAFNYLIKYSPIHNVKPIAYPATMVTTADHDDRVVPAHSFKYAATLQEKHTGDNPVLIRIETSAGHGAGKPTSKRIEEAADILAFMFYNMGERFNY
ncbi:UNVERIFIED_CONTAM: hypothetical protein GTU68_035435 [Idotea baltica]|nr:hypothetical protein [Idotea baltica]